MINYMLPGLYVHHKLNIIFISLFKTHPEYFYDNINIHSVYGTFQFCTWDGGRIFHECNYSSKEFIERLTFIYNDILNVSMRFTFTNSLIKETDCDDVYNNLILKTCHDIQNEIVINSPILENYIKNNYPNYNFVLSTTACLSDKEILNLVNNTDYKMICLDVLLNKNQNFINKIPIEHRNKIEFLINAICPPGCPFRADHYKLQSQFGLTCGKPFKLEGCAVYLNKNNNPYNYSHNFSLEEINNYHDQGFQYFKLEGRTFSETKILLNLIKYMIKPEYAFMVINYILIKLNTFNIWNYDIEEYINDDIAYLINYF